MADVIYSATVDAKGALINLDLIGKKIEKVAVAGSKDFEKISKSASASGVQIGAISGIVSSLTTKFIELGQRMVHAFSQGIKESVSLASSLETTGAIFKGVLQGNEPAAIAALQHIRAESRKLGIDLTETSRAFLPFVASLEELDRVNKISAALAISQPEQGQLGARIALQEALSGNVQSLVRRFEIPKQLGKELQHALDDGGVVEFLDVFEGIMKRLGRDVENLTDTFQFSFGRAAESAKQLQTAFGQPILEELKVQFDELNKIVAENFDDYTLIADTFGRIFAHVVDIIGSGLTDFLTNLDTEQVLEIGETFFDIVENVRLFGALLSDMDVPQTLLDNVQSIAEGLATALDTAIKLAGIVKAQRAEEAGKAKALEGLGLPARSGGVPTELLLSEDQKAQVEAAGDKAFRDSILETNKAIEASNKLKEENRKATDDLGDAQKRGAKAATELTDAQLALNKAEADLATLEEDVAGAQAKVAEAEADAAKDRDRKFEDIDIAFERKRLDIQLEFAQKREDAAKNHLEKLADLQLKNSQDIDDAATDLGRKEEAIADKFSEQRLDLEREQRQKRLDIETSFREKLQDIQEQSSFDLDEAEQKRDAVSFLRILREQQKQVSAAQVDRQREIEELRIQGQRKKEETTIQQDREIAEARLANEEKLADLRLNLERQIEAQNLAFDRQIEDIAINEQRKNDEAAVARERDIEDAKLAYDRKLADLKESLAAEYALLEEAAAKKLALLEEIAAAEASIGPSRTGGSAAGLGPVPGTLTGHIPADRPTHAGPRPFPVGGPGRPGGGGPRRQYGGLVNAGQVYETHANELFVPSSNGRIIPNSPTLMQNLGSSLGGGISNSKSQEFNFPVGDASLFNDVIFMAKLKNVILSTLDGVG